MKLRVEQFGLHYFNRKTGLHILLDEVKTQKCEYSVAPRTISIAITDDCNSNCHFCHVKKGKNYLPKEFIIDISKNVDALGCFDIALGGGEPLLHPDLIEICQTIWNNTSLGISITTNGKLLNNSIIESLIGNVSFIRISIDSPNEKNYLRIRGFPLQTLKRNINMLTNKIPFGINMVITKDTINELDEMLEFAIGIGAEELLVLPHIEMGEIVLDGNLLKKLEGWLLINYTKFPIKVLEQARELINVPVLFEDSRYYNDYLYVSAQRKLQRSSYTLDGYPIENDNFENLLKEWRKEILI